MTAPSPELVSGSATLARRVIVGAAVLGILADALLRNEPWGIGLLVWMSALAAVVVVFARERQPQRSLSTESRTWLALAVLFATGLSWRDADILLAFDVVAMLSALVLLAMSLNGLPVLHLSAARVRDLIFAAVGTGIAVASGVVPLVFRDAELHTALRPTHEGTAKRIVRALVITAPIVFVFGLLLTRADPVFGSFFAFPDVDVEQLVSHVFITGFFGWVVAGWLRRALLARPNTVDSTLTPFPLALGATDITIALGALSVLFAAFVIAQLSWFYGGESYVLKTTGLTFATYARRGFFELAAVAGLLLPVLLGAHALIPASDSRTQQIFRRLALLLVLLLGVILCSAGARMRLYIQYYGISADRLYASAFMIWLAIVFVWLSLTVLRARPRAFAWGLVVSAYAVLITLNILNPDAMVARANLARGDATTAGATTFGATGRDLTYLASLGGDAVPLVVSALLTARAVAETTVPNDRCVAAGVLLNRWTGKDHARRTRSWTQWNRARANASEAVSANEAALQQLRCPLVPTKSGVVTP